jgi:flagellin-like hook-associated protein FlgL
MIRSAELRKVERSLQARISVLQDRISRSQVADGAYAEMERILVRMEELHLTAASGGRSEAEVEALQTEMDSLVESLGFVSASSVYEGAPVMEMGEPLQSMVGEGASVVGDATLTHDALFQVASARAGAGAQAEAWRSQVGSLEEARSEAVGAGSAVADARAAEALLGIAQAELTRRAAAGLLGKLVDIAPDRAASLLGARAHLIGPGEGAGRQAKLTRGSRSPPRPR